MPPFHICVEQWYLMADPIVHPLPNWWCTMNGSENVLKTVIII
jgi:hypothetical protein